MPDQFVRSGSYMYVLNRNMFLSGYVLERRALYLLIVQQFECLYRTIVYDYKQQYDTNIQTDWKITS